MTDQGNGQPAPKRYVIVDHDGKSVEISGNYEDDIVLALGDMMRSLPIGGRFTVTRVS